jgi:hypothetical protein
MAWTTPLTATSNTALTAAQWNASVRDNLLETPAAKFTAAGQIFVSTAANAGAARSVAAGRVGGGSQQTSSATLADNLTTVGPSVTLNTGTAALVMVTAFIMNTTAGQGGYMGYNVSGASTIAATADRTLRLMSDTASVRNRATAANWQTGLTTGSNTFKAQYSVVATGTADFDEREIAVLPLS